MRQEEGGTAVFSNADIKTDYFIYLRSKVSNTLKSDTNNVRVIMCYCIWTINKLEWNGMGWN